MTGRKKKKTRYIWVAVCLFTLASYLMVSSPTNGIIPKLDFSPSQVGKIISPQMSDLHHNQPIVFDGYAVLAGNAVHEIWDISDPYHPFLKSTLTSDHHDGEAESHQLTLSRNAQGNYYMATTSGKGFDIWDLTDINNPEYVIAMEIPGVDYGDVDNAVWGLCWQGNYLYIGATNHGIFVVNVSDITDPKITTNIPLTDLSGVKAGPLFALGNILVVTTPKNNNGVATIDISNPAFPVVLDRENFQNTESYIGGFYGKNAVLINPVRFYDVTTDPANIQLTSTLNTIQSEYVSFDNGKLFLGSLRGGNQGIHIFDISNLNNITKTLYVEGRSIEWDDQFSCPVGNMLIISDDQKVNGQYVGSVIAVHEEKRDTLGPAIIYTNPISNAQNVSLLPSIGISFSDWIEFKTVNESSFILRSESGDIIPGTWSWLYTTLNFTPKDTLTKNTRYEVYIPSNGLTDLSGNPLAEDYSFYFTTGINDPTSLINPVISGNDPVSIGTGSAWNIDNPNATFMYEWEIEGEIIGEGNQASYTFEETGRHQVCVEVYAQTLTEADKQYEAETATLSNVTFSSNHPGFTGTGFVDYPPDQGDTIFIQWEIEWAAEDTIDLTIRYANGDTFDRPLNLVLNNGTAIPLNFPVSGSWSSYADQTVTGLILNSGPNTIKLIANNGSQGPNIDHLRATETGKPGKLVASKCFIQVVYEETTHSPTSSQSMVLDGTNLWCVNPDAGSISAINLDNLTKINEIQVGNHPQSLAKAGDRLWVVNRDSWDISIIDLPNQILEKTIKLPVNSQPGHLLVSSDSRFAYLSLSATGQLVKMGIEEEVILESLSLNEGPRENTPALGGMALTADGTKLLLNRFISTPEYAEVYEVETETMTLTNTIRLNNLETVDASNAARGIPNYLNNIAIHPKGAFALIPSKQDNLQRGGYRDGLSLDHQSTVRAVISRIDLNTMTEQIDQRFDVDNSDRCHAITFNQRGDLAFISLPGNHKIVITNAETGEKITELGTGLVPDAIVVDDSSGRLFVHNFLSRSISVWDIDQIMDGSGGEELITEIPVVSSEPLSESVLLGKQLFYDASSKKINQSGYMSCASCHLDGSHDGQTWDFTSLGEGFRNTIDLRGRSGTKHGRLHWTGNFDEVHDFENQLRNLGGGTGLMSDPDFELTAATLGNPKNGLSDSLDALSAYISSLEKTPPSPYRTATGNLTNNGLLGRDLFYSFSCPTCHFGEEFTDSPFDIFHDVGTIKPSSGKRLNSELKGFDTPTLKGVWNTAPYLHDGSASTLEEAIAAHSNDTITAPDMELLIEYLLQLDDSGQNGTLTSNVLLNKKVKVYPNPVTGDGLNIQILTTADFNWLLFNIDGKLLKSGNTRNILAHDLENGLYILEVHLEGTITRKKVIILR